MPNRKSVVLCAIVTNTSWPALFPYKPLSFGLSSIDPGRNQQLRTGCRGGQGRRRRRHARQFPSRRTQVRVPQAERGISTRHPGGQRRNHRGNFPPVLGRRRRCDQPGGVDTRVQMPRFLVENRCKLTFISGFLNLFQSRDSAFVHMPSLTTARQSGRLFGTHCASDLTKTTCLRTKDVEESKSIPHVRNDQGDTLK